MKRCLIMITSGFPYGISETYIESEVAFLKDHFERVIILPIELDPGEPIMRALPDGIEYYNVSQKKQSVARTGDIVGGLRNIISGTRKKSDRISEKECSLSIFVTVLSEAIGNA